MAKEKAPAFQFYPRDFIADINVQAMTMEERGVYLWLLCHCWNEGSLPSDLSKLARICSVSGRRFTHLWEAIAPCFDVAGDHLTHKRLDLERQKQAAWNEQRAQAGRASAAARWGHHHDERDDNEPVTDAQRNGNERLTDMVTDGQRKHASSLCTLHFASVELSQKETEEPPEFGPDDEPRDPVTDAIGWFFGSYPLWFSEERNGAKYPPKPARDLPTARELVTTWPDRVHLEQMARTFLRSTSMEQKWASRTIGQFAHWAPAIDAQLRGA